MSAASPTVDDVVRMEQRAWDEMNHHARVASSLLLCGDLDGARERAGRSATAGEWRVEAAQQLRDVRRTVSL